MNPRPATRGSGEAYQGSGGLGEGGQTAEDSTATPLVPAASPGVAPIDSLIALVSGDAPANSGWLRSNWQWRRLVEGEKEETKLVVCFWRPGELAFYRRMRRPRGHGKATVEVALRCAKGQGSGAGRLSRSRRTSLWSRRGQWELGSAGDLRWPAYCAVVVFIRGGMASLRC